MIQSIQHAYCLGYIKRIMVHFMLERERGARDMKGQGERQTHTESKRKRICNRKMATDGRE